jgi:MHS family proline/betaine transporter-like MFS transporter
MNTAIAEVDSATLRKVIGAAAIGNFVEWFDFAVYGFLATTIAQQFFASGDSTVALLKTFAVFAVAFAFCPPMRRSACGPRRY